MGSLLDEPGESQHASGFHSHECGFWLYCLCRVKIWRGRRSEVVFGKSSDSERIGSVIRTLAIVSMLVLQSASPFAWLRT
jgi:hypothetical protein